MGGLSSVSISITSAIVYGVFGAIFFLLIFLLVLLGVTDCNWDCNRLLRASSLLLSDPIGKLLSKFTSMLNAKYLVSVLTLRPE